MQKYILKMTPREFIRKVIELYFSSRESAYYHPKIKRGRSRTVSGLVEDLFTSFLSFNLLEDFDFYVDQPLTIKENTIYPDITIVDNKIIKNFVDIKMDLGWNRDGFISFCEAKQNLVKQIQNKEARIKDGITKKGTILQIHGKIKYHIVIISDQNIPKAKFDSNRVGVKKLKDVEVYVLSGNKHPNAYQKHIEELLNSINIHENEFTRLFKNISK